MRQLLLSLLFFFGPVLLMFVLRHLGLLLRIWLLYRRAKQSNREDIIDITPETPHPPSKVFIIATILLGIGFAVLAYHQMGAGPEPGREYVPAKMGEGGKVVPGQYK